MSTLYDNVLPIYAAIAGDVVGSWLEDKKEKLLTFNDYPLFCNKCFPTDDSVFTVAIAECMLDGTVTTDEVVKHLQKWGRKYPDAGFGTTTRKWIFSDAPKPYGSNRNGGAMRVSPCGVVANTLDEALQLAAITCNVSHNTPEGVDGAQAIAAAVFLARTGKKKEEIKAYIEGRFGYDLDTSIEYQKGHYAGFSCEAKVTVPQAIRCFLESHDVESAIRLGISLGSDADTIASMAAAIAAAYYRELPLLNELLPYIPECMQDVVNRLNDKLKDNSPKK